MNRLTGPLLLATSVLWLMAGIVWPVAKLDGWGAIPAGLLGGVGLSLIIVRWATRP